MRPGGQAGSSDSAYWLLPDDQIAYIYSHLMQMHIDRIDPGKMFDNHRISCYYSVLDQNDSPSAGSPDRRSCWVSVIYAIVDTPGCTIVGIDISPYIAKQGSPAFTGHWSNETLVQVLLSGVYTAQKCQVTAGLLIFPWVRINPEARQSLIQLYIIPPEIPPPNLSPEFGGGVSIPINNHYYRSSDRRIHRHTKEEHHRAGSNITPGMNGEGKTLYGHKIPVIAFLQATLPGNGKSGKAGAVTSVFIMDNGMKICVFIQPGSGHGTTIHIGKVDKEGRFSLTQPIYREECPGFKGSNKRRK